MYSCSYHSRLVLSGIPVSNYSHVSYFPSRENYDEFYAFIIRVVNIAFEKFATFVQALLVRHLSIFGDKPAEWYEEIGVMVDRCAWSILSMGARD